jgi:hypothetical protein
MICENFWFFLYSRVAASYSTSMSDVQNEQGRDQALEYPPILDEVGDDVLIEAQAAFRSEPALSEAGGGSKHRAWKREAVRDVLAVTASAEQFIRLANAITVANESLKSTATPVITDVITPALARLLSDPAASEQAAVQGVT